MKDENIIPKTIYHPTLISIVDNRVKNIIQKQEEHTS